MSTPQNRYKIDELGRLRRRTQNGQYEIIATVQALSDESRAQMLAELRTLACGIPGCREVARDIACKYLSRVQQGPGRPPLPPDAGKKSNLIVRLEPRRKAAYVKAAGKSPSRKLSPWVLAALDQAAGYADS